MTLNNEDHRINEIQQRRKLRLQQVREQSKDIAKKIRQRAKLAKLRHILEVDSKKEKEYFECQEKLVKRLEQLYAEGVNNVGAAHKNVVENSLDVVNKKDLSKLRGKEAAATLRRAKQEKLDEQKKLLDRKLKAREAANELSREKSTAVLKALDKPSKITEVHKETLADDTNKIVEENKINQDCSKDHVDLTKNDMGTQWELEEVPKEWEPNVPSLPLSDGNPKDSTSENAEQTSKRLNLFALSEEMVQNLNNDNTTNINDRPFTKPSVTLVSEYLQNRSLRLRQTEPLQMKTDDLNSIKQTILRTRAPKRNGRVFDDVCHVLDEQVIPVPSWQAENYCKLCNNVKNDNILPNFVKNSCKKNIKSCLQHNSHIYERSVISQRDVPTYTGRGRHNVCDRNCLKSGTISKGKLSPTNIPEVRLNRKDPVTVYNHNTKDARSVPQGTASFVQRDEKSEDDAYSQALRETVNTNNLEKEQLNKVQKDLRNRIAVQKHTVNKEYKETLAFLSNLPKNKGDYSKTTYMTEDQHKQHRERHQKKVQMEFQRVEQESCRRNCKHKRKAENSERSHSKSRSPVNFEIEGKEMYSWLPVPEGDGSLAIHTLPNTTKNKGANSVKFSTINSYHEYRSRHKHTPPTKDVSKGHNKKVVETVVIDQNESTDYDDSTPTESNSSEDLNLEQNSKTEQNHSRFSDAERIIIYKILDKTKKKENTKKKTSKSLSTKSESIEVSGKDNQNLKDVQKGVCFDQLQEGIYKGVSKNGDNIESIELSGIVSEHLDFENKPTKLSNSEPVPKKQGSHCIENHNKTPKDHVNTDGDSSTSNHNQHVPPPSNATSASSFKTASNSKSSNDIPNNSFIKILDENGKEGGKFYIGASGFLKNDNYEVVIQLRKKDSENHSRKTKILSESESNKGNYVNLLQQTQAEVSIQDINPNSQKEYVGDTEKMLSPVQVIDIENKKVQPSVQVTDTENNKNVTNPQTIPDDNKNNDKQNSAVSTDSTNEIAEVCDKSVITSFHDHYVDIPKLDPVLKPAISTYTQTTFNSPLPRPAYMHMSSSTSTAYLSPPEVMLPDFLKHNYSPSNEELYESEYSSLLQKETLNIRQKHCHEIKRKHFNNLKDQNKCPERLTVLSQRHCSRKSNLNIVAPPNTARNQNCDKSTTDNKSCKKRAKKCSKYDNRSDCKLKCKSCRNKSKHISSVKSLDGIPLKIVGHQRVNTKQIQASKYRISHLDPILKQYVGKLLSLKEVGLQAVEVLNQDCSEVNTPGSSIINVASNIDERKPIGDKISLEQIKKILVHKILVENATNDKFTKSNKRGTENIPVMKKTSQISKRRPVHKIKSFNVSKRLIKPNKCNKMQSVNNCYEKQSMSSPAEERINVTDVARNKSRSKSSPTPRTNYKNDLNCSTQSDPIRKQHIHKNKRIEENVISSGTSKQYQRKDSTNSDSEINNLFSRYLTSSQVPINISTQTNGIIINNEINYMKIAEDKLQNMEKIADLTDKCTKRLSNLAKVLEEVRRNKSVVYNQISSSDSTSEQDFKTDKKLPNKVYPNSDVDIYSERTKINVAPDPTSQVDTTKERNSVKPSVEFVPLLKDIPKPNLCKSSLDTENSNIDGKSFVNSIKANTVDYTGTKYRGKPPPALSRLQHKRVVDPFVTPHELSTVIEVDSPMSLKMKSHLSKRDVPDKTTKTTYKNTNYDDSNTVFKGNILENRSSTSKFNINLSTTDSSEDSKLQMMDMKQFNDIMLKPFITLRDYAKQCNIGVDEGSNNDDILKGSPLNDEISSTFHSDSSLPDVIGELLKRNIISEPFKFDSGSNNNSTALSSESTLSILALSNVYKQRLTDAVLNRKDTAETSETISISSNPDLENAFQKLGMGWASSTLKKTKERLALTSSSSASSSSMPRFKTKGINHDLEDLTTEINSPQKITTKKDKDQLVSGRLVSDSLKNAVQQTSLTNSLTVKEFLTNELAKKITFTNKSLSKEAEVEFISLYETKMPDEIKNNKTGHEESNFSATSNNNRARTSTPVQIFKSTKYRSSSSSNTSNGLFSNADDLSSVKVTSNSIRNHSTSDKEDLTIPNYSLQVKITHNSKSD